MVTLKKGNVFIRESDPSRIKEFLVMGYEKVEDNPKKGGKGGKK